MSIAPIEATSFFVFLLHFNYKFKNVLKNKKDTADSGIWLLSD